MNESVSETKWWNRKVLKLPVWALIVLGVFVVSVIGSSSSQEESTDTTAAAADTTAPSQSDTTSPQVDTTAAPVTTAAPAKPKLTASQENAIKSALSYLDFSAFSKEGLIQQLSSEYGEKFPLADATFAVNYIEKDPGVDWNEQAAKSAQSYLKTSSFSCQGLIDQLSSEYGEKFTEAQATYGATKAGLC